MKQIWIIAIGCMIFGESSGNDDVDLRFPKNLMIGVGSASHQIEGAWNVSDKGENIWDRYTHTHPEAIANRSNADIACNSYYKYKEDVKRIKDIGLNFYRFSISWARILPHGFPNKISEVGLAYYKNLTKELVKNGIRPIVTLYHWDHPQILEEFGGWTNERMIYLFVSYARIIFAALGNHVKIWITFNEPNIFCPGAYDGHESGPKLAPGKELIGIGKYLCVHNLLKAHAKTYWMYDEEFRATQKGEVGIVPHCPSMEAVNSSDTVSADTGFQFECGWVAHAIYIGDYPEIMKQRIAMVSKAQGYGVSRLPEFSEKWKSLIKGTADYFGMNFYTSYLVSPNPDEKRGIHTTDNGLITTADPSWPTTSVRGIYVTPEGLGNVLRKIKEEYNNPPVRIMENGYSDDGTLKDYDRIKFYYDYMRSMLTAIKEHKCWVKSYSIWTLIDDFEWNSGYAPKFGIYSVDFNDPDRPRTARLSASWWRSVLRTRKLQPVPTANRY